jgi:hypothetical protein
VNSVERTLVEYIAINARKGKAVALAAYLSDNNEHSGLVDFFQQIEDHTKRLLEEDAGGH